MSEADELMREITKGFHEPLTRFIKSWKNIGICDRQKVERTNAVANHVLTLLNEMADEEENLATRLMSSLEECSAELVKLSNELAIDIYKPPDGLTLLQLERDVRTKVDNLLLEKHARMKKFKKLREQNKTLSDSLGTEPCFIPNCVVPSEELLLQIEEHTQILVAEKETRRKKFYSTKNAILALYEELEKQPSLDEQELLNNEYLVLSLETLTISENLKQELESFVNFNASEGLILRENLAKLWDRLNIEQTERDKFLSLYPGSRPTTLKALRDEIEKLKLIQRQNLKKFITSTRKDLVDMWDKCLIGKDQRDLFRAIHDDSFNEELLEIHLFEVEKMNNYYQDNKDLLQKIARRNQLWDRMLEFEKRASDPNRFNNRGGNLLQEEKERKKLQKELPHLEKELERLALEWEIKHAKIFMVNGQRLVDYVEKQWQTYRNDKENEKLERQRAKAQQIEEEMYKGSKTLTPGNKRKLDTPRTPSRRKLQENQTPKIHSSLALYNSPVRHLPRSVKKSAMNRSKRVRASPVGGTLIRKNLLKDRNCDIFNQTTISSNAVTNNALTSLDNTVNSYRDFSTNIRILDGIFNSTSGKISPRTSPLRNDDRVTDSNE